MATKSLLSEHAARHANVLGRRTHYHIAGQGEPVVLLHGLCGSTLWWSRNVAALATRFHVYALDLPGFGALGWRSRFELDTAAAWVYDWMHTVGLKRAHVVGHSMGGYIAMRLAAAEPAAVARLALVAPAGVPMQRSLAGQLKPLALAACRSNPTFLPILAYDALRAGPLTAARTGLDLVAQDVRAAARRIHAPTLLVWGRHDPLVPPAHGVVLRRHIRNSRILYLDHAGHMPMYDCPRHFNAALLSFLEGAAVGA
jgi:pimeloyl-ACP methyl ester carboxylesterase